MDRIEETNLLKHIVTLLFVLAGLAERASAMPAAARCRVLGILRRAEIVAHASVAGSPLCPGSSTASFEGDDPADAARLALRLRTLALAWAALLAWLQQFAGRPVEYRRLQVFGCVAALDRRYRAPEPFRPPP